MSGDPTLRALTEALAAGTPAPGGGAAAAAAAAMAAALAAMVGRLALKRAGEEARAGWTDLVDSADRKRERLLALVDEDAAAYQAVVDAGRGSTGDAAARDAQLAVAWRGAVRTSAEVVRLARDLALLARRGAREGPAPAAGDAVMAGLLAAAAAAGSQLNLRANVEGAGRPETLRVLADESEVILREAQRAAIEARTALEERLRPSGPGGRPS